MTRPPQPKALSHGRDVAAEQPESAPPVRSVREEAAATADALLPWGLSVLLHLSIGLLALFAVWSMRAAPPADKPLVPTIRATLPDAEQLRVTRELASEADAAFEQPSRMQTPATRTTPTEAALRVIGVTGLDLPPVKPMPRGLAGEANWLSVGEAADGRGGQRPGEPGRPDSIVYVIDASGSMVDTLAYVQRELLGAIHRLDADQRFTVIFFQQDAAIAAMPAGLHRATGEAVRLAEHRVGVGTCVVQPRGSSNPTAALTLAISYRPDAIVLLSDNITGAGRYAVALDDLLATIERTRHSRGAVNTRIHTVQFLRPEPQEALRRIAEATGGRYRFVEADSLR